MRLSNLADYAVVTMSAAARHCGGGRTSAAELAAETGLPAPTVAKLVSKLWQIAKKRASAMRGVAVRWLATATIGMRNGAAMPVASTLIALPMIR